MHPGIAVQKSRIDRRGVFCVCDSIEKGVFLAAYTGTVSTKENPNSYTCVEVEPGLGLFIEGKRSRYAKTEAERAARYFNSISRWDGSLSGGANCRLYSQYPTWPYVYIVTLRRVTKGEELLIDYHWFPEITSIEPCAANCPRKCAAKNVAVVV